MAESAVEVEGLVKHYGKVEALAGISLTVWRGEMFALLGPNGAGKTTLFSILTTLRKPTRGHARVLGSDVVRERDRVRARMGIVFQEPALAGRLSVRDNLQLMGLFYGLGHAASRRRSDELLETLGLAEAAGRARKSFPAARNGGSNSPARSSLHRKFSFSTRRHSDSTWRHAAPSGGKSAPKSRPGARSFLLPITWKKPKWPTG